MSRFINSNGANPKVDSHVSFVWDLPLHGRDVAEWYPAVGSHSASPHSEEIPSR